MQKNIRPLAQTPLKSSNLANLTEVFFTGLDRTITWSVMLSCMMMQFTQSKSDNRIKDGKKKVKDKGFGALTLALHSRLSPVQLSGLHQGSAGSQGTYNLVGEMQLTYFHTITFQ